MIRKTTKLIILTIAALAACINANAQTHADARIAELVGNGDMLQLHEEYPKLKDSTSMEMLNLLAESQLGISFNRLEDAATALDSLLQFHQEALGPETSIGLAALRAMNLLNMGDYAEAGKAGEDLVNALKGSLPFESLYSFMFIEKIGKALAGTPAHKIERPAYDVEVPMTVTKAGRGNHLCIPAEVNGITRNFIFDTGCSFGNFVSETYAEEAGLTIVADSIPVSGMSIGYVKLAVADSMKIGEIICRNPVFMVAPANTGIDSVSTFDGVLGYHFIRDVKETIIDNESGKFIFPYRISEGTPNMYMSSNTPKLQICYEGKPFDITLDTGNVKSDLGNDFANKFPDAIEGLEPHVSARGGFGGMADVKVVTLPEFQFSLGDKCVTLHGTEVIPESPGSSQLFSGSLGADFIMSFRRISINYENSCVSGL